MIEMPEEQLCRLLDEIEEQNKCKKKENRCEKQQLTYIATYIETNNKKHSNSAIPTKDHYCVTNLSNLLSLKSGFKTMTLTN